MRTCLSNGRLSILFWCCLAGDAIRGNTFSVSSNRSLGSLQSLQMYLLFVDSILQHRRAFRSIFRLFLSISVQAKRKRRQYRPLRHTSFEFAWWTNFEFHYDLKCSFKLQQVLLCPLFRSISICFVITMITSVKIIYIDSYSHGHDR